MSFHARGSKLSDSKAKMESLCSYLPASILSHLVSHSETPAALAPPFRQTYTTAVLFADVSGYTQMCEQMSMRGSRIAPIHSSLSAPQPAGGAGGGGAAGGGGGGDAAGSDLATALKPKERGYLSSKFHLHHSLSGLQQQQQAAAHPQHPHAASFSSNAASLHAPPAASAGHHHSLLHHSITLPSFLDADGAAPTASAASPSPSAASASSSLSRSQSSSGLSGSLSLSTSYGPGGDELLAKHLNSYFEQLVKIISSHGGDVFKFAGDAILVLWPQSTAAAGAAADEDDEADLLTRVRRAAQCGMEIKTRLQDIAMGDGITLSMKVGVGVGEISILHVGGVFDRMEYIATGHPLLQAFAAEHQAMQRDVVISPQAWAMISPFFTTAGLSPSGYAILRSCSEPLRKVSVAANLKHGALFTGGVRDAELMRTLGRYVPGAVLPYISRQEEKWASELRRITVLFVNLGLMNDSASGGQPAAAPPATTAAAAAAAASPPADPTAELLFVQSIVHATQLAVYKYEGSVNKFLRDDKGSTLIAVFGLPPLAHEDDAVRGILAALAICARLIDLGLKPSVGVTTGQAFCGIVGTRGRREYSVMGDKVNLAARLMQARQPWLRRRAVRPRDALRSQGPPALRGGRQDQRQGQEQSRSASTSPTRAASPQLFSLQGKRDEEGERWAASSWTARLGLRRAKQGRRSALQAVRALWRAAATAG